MPRCDWKSLCLLLLLSLAAVPEPATAAAATAAITAGAAPPPVAPWCQAYAPAARPLHVAMDEALESLGHGWGPDSRGLGYPLHEALLPVAALLPVPDPLLDRRLRRALLSLEGAADACMKAMPMTTRLRLVEGARALAELESGLAAVSPGCLPACPTGPSVPAPGCRSGGAALTLVVGVEGEGLALADTPLGSQRPQGTAAAAPETRGAEKARARRSAPRGSKQPPPTRPKPHRSGALWR
jgi:hypothetical protein